MHSTEVEIEVGGQTLLVTAEWTPRIPATTQTPEEGGEFTVVVVELLAGIYKNPHQKLDITELLAACDNLDHVTQVASEKFDADGGFDPQHPDDLEDE